MRTGGGGAAVDGQDPFPLQRTGLIYHVEHGVVASIAGRHLEHSSRAGAVAGSGTELGEGTPASSNKGAFTGAAVTRAGPGEGLTCRPVQSACPKEGRPLRWQSTETPPPLPSNGVAAR